MLSLENRLELLKGDLLHEPPSFVMTRELPFAIFRYDPGDIKESEWIVRRQIQLLTIQIENETKQHVEVRSLASLFWKSVQESEDVAGLFALERDNSFAVAERQVNQYLSDADFRPLCDLLREEEAKFPANTRVLFLTHATVFAPSAYRISALFEQLHRSFKTPTVLFYPGTWKHTLNYMGLRSADQALGSYRVKIYGRDT
ncbi:MAG: DUF1788 domain-containing protein [Acidobacteria bacterium]|nr:DUF1788 domain-containing protein [Acidobacteriota bacterium]